MKSEPGPPMTLGAAAATSVRLIVWCRECSHQVEPNAAKLSERYGAETNVLEWKDRLACSRGPSGRHGDDRDEAVLGSKLRNTAPGVEIPGAAVLPTRLNVPKAKRRSILSWLKLITRFPVRTGHWHRRRWDKTRSDSSRGLAPKAIQPGTGISCRKHREGNPGGNRSRPAPFPERGSHGRSRAPLSA
jgi:hypothetical protein